MDIQLKYKEGITYITDGEYSGYEPSRGDIIVSATIQYNNYSFILSHHTIRIKHKYLSIAYNIQYTIGRWIYHIDSLMNYKGQERKELLYMHSLLNELVNNCTIDGLVLSHRITPIINTHR
ncbi:TPA: hypothetical protein MFN52_005085 [Klebsiella quasipneumoniae subsp. similipneumoniae]|nr:hypothetical protein [Klebsiella quasipneumoniae subsp. similipneumoniae]